ncbi:hypothetical protein, partial [Streptomyces smyrnaeus]|uniref:hypothetical protein n=1 Tax=Streptomyces smyrnaeus TaxID=1387713 RepID=UPI0036C7B5BE
TATEATVWFAAPLGLRGAVRHTAPTLLELTMRGRIVGLHFGCTNRKAAVAFHGSDLYPVRQGSFVSEVPDLTWPASSPERCEEPWATYYVSGRGVVDAASMGSDCFGGPAVCGGCGLTSPSCGGESDGVVDPDPVF